MNFTILPRHRAAISASSLQTGSALIVTLAFIVLLTALMLAFLSRSGINQRIAGASADDSKADLIAKTGLDVIVGDFRQEIAAGSSVTANTTSFPSSPIYLPLNASNTPPARILTTAESTYEPNLIRRSMASAEFLTNAATLNATYSGFPENNLASADSSANQAASGRSVVASRWNKPGLLTNTTASTFVAPDWVLVTRNGPKAFTAWDATVKDSSPANTNYVVGRYAYNVYNEGGLLDANVVGRYANGANTIPTPPLGKAAVAGLADLTMLNNAIAGCVPSQTAVNNLVAYRNASTTTTVYNSTTPSDPTTYFGYLTGSTNSFTKVHPGDEAFLTRQDLINYLASGASGITTNALPYLGTFTRQVNAPSFYPALTNFKNTLVANATHTDRPMEGASGAVNDTATISSQRAAEIGLDNQQYASASDMFNPALPDVRFPVSATLPDGTSVTAGQPLLRKRFALSRLALLTASAISSSATPTDSADLIYRYFGLTRTTVSQAYGSNTVTTSWTYNHGGSAGQIMTLKELQDYIQANPSKARDPDFFELLQASIAVGSLGRDAGNPDPGQDTLSGPSGTGDTALPTLTAPAPSLLNQSATMHILQIGANIIDQASTGFDPISISDGNSHTVYGEEDLPAINKVLQLICHDGMTSTTISAWYLFELWNPYQTQRSVAGPNYPTNFRITANPPNGIASSSYLDLKAGANPSEYLSFPAQDFTAAGTGTNYLQFTPNATSTFNVPTVLSQSTATVTSPVPKNIQSQTLNNGADTWTGLYVGTITDPGPGTTSWTSHEIRPGTVTAARSTSSTDKPGFVSFSVQCQTSTGAWQTYNQIRDVFQSKNPLGSNQLFDFYLPGGSVFMYCKLDPRTDRFSVGTDSDFAISGSIPTRVGKTWLWDPKGAPGGYNPKLNGWYWPFEMGSGFSQPGTASGPSPTGNFWSLNQNNDAANSYYYKDPDGVVRRGDDMYSLPTTGDANSSFGFSMNMTTPNGGTSAAAPYISRPLLLHRPFQSVGELGYTFRDVPWKSIDFFTSRSGDSALLDVFSANEEPSVVAGKVDVNTRNAPVLAALLTGGAIDELGSVATSTGVPTGISALEAYNTATGNGFSQRLLLATAASPFHNKSDLVNRLNGNTVWNDTGASPANPITADGWGEAFIANGIFTARQQQERIKMNRESALRSLSEATATRTWNLLIDIIAQSGRYAPTATGLANFTIGGEKRYWLHVAIDRYTGKIVDEQLEPVYE